VDAAAPSILESAAKAAEAAKPPTADAAKPPTANPAEQVAKPPTAEQVAQPAETVVEPPPPIEYQPFQFVEGFEPDQKVLGTFTDVLKEHRAPQELGQKLLDLYTSEIEKIGNAQTEVWNKLQSDWQKQVKDDPDIGGDNLPQVLSRAARVLDTYGTPDLRKVMTLTGAGNHPEMVKFISKVADALSEARPVPAPAGPALRPQSRAQKRYGSTTPG